MSMLKFINNDGDFVLKGAQRYQGTYFPLVNEAGMISSVTPMLGGDCKTDQNTYLLPPAGAETLHESRAARNFWIMSEGREPWSAAGQSAAQQAARFSDSEEETVLRGGLLWQEVSREQKDTGLRASVLSFVPSGNEKAEIMQVTIQNCGSEPIEITPAAAIPLYGRSADNIRDHRHVTSLLHRIELRPHGLDVTPTLTFDERGHRPGNVTYRVWGGDETGGPPQSFIALTRDFVGEGSWDHPEAIFRPNEAVRLRAGQCVEGGEAAAVLFFSPVMLKAGDKRRYQIILATDDSPSHYLLPDAVDAALENTKCWWRERAVQSFSIRDKDFCPWMRWVSVQPILRRICGCSFLPHHDYGRDGRGWRDLWQDSLALLLTSPNEVRGDLLSYFAGVRPDGTNATIIGTVPGEFKADRNNIPRVWMDHGFWPLLTVALYIDETGDTDFLLEEQSYFSDTLSYRGEWPRECADMPKRSGTVFEHILTQLTTAFYDVGEHGFMRLRGADWNDGLDMAKERGESVAFTAAYAYGFDLLAKLTEKLEGDLYIANPLARLLAFPRYDWNDTEKMRRALTEYCAAADKSGEKEKISSALLSKAIGEMADRLRRHINETEWVGDGADLHWFNSYYDNSGRQVEGLRGKTVRMMLTGQVFTILSGTADDSKLHEIVRAADWYLDDPTRGGYCLNTDFGEVKLDMGRMFGFAYGSKENGAVFSHMAVMYAYALYSRGLAHEGRRVLERLYRQSMDFAKSRILPGIPEYFDERGQGMYPYLTGAASWFLLTLQTQVFGVAGHMGDLAISPKLTADMFDDSGTAKIECTAAGRRVWVQYINPLALDWGEYDIDFAACKERKWIGKGTTVIIPREELPNNGQLSLTVTLCRKGARADV